MAPRIGVMASAWLCGTPEGNMGSNLCELHLARARLPGRGVGTVSPVCQPCVVGRETPLLRVLGSLRSAGSGCPCLSATSFFHKPFYCHSLPAVFAFPTNLFRWLPFFFFCMFLYLRSLSVSCHLCPSVHLAVCPSVPGSGLALASTSASPISLSATLPPPLSPLSLSFFFFSDQDWLQF